MINLKELSKYKLEKYLEGIDVSINAKEQILERWKYEHTKPKQEVKE